MVYNLQEILSLITYSVITVVGLLLLLVLIRFFEVLGLLREILKKIIFHRTNFTETLRQLRLFCQKYTQDPED